MNLVYFVFIVFVYSNFLCNATFISNRENDKESDKIESLENNALLEGDIIPNANEENSNATDAANFYHAVASKSSKWPRGIINFKLDKRFYDDEVDKIIDSMYRIEKISCIRFRPYKPVYGLDYVKIFKGVGCYSSAGRVGGMQTLSLGKGCINTGTILHELLHTVGFYHHHMRSDRDKYLNIHFNNIRKEYRSQFVKLPKSNVKLLTPFDYQSIMIYGSKAFSKNDKPTMTAKIRNVRLTYPFNKHKLTKYDKIAINRLYKCSKKSKRRSSLIFFSDSPDEEEDDDDEVDFPKVDEIKVEEAKDDEDVDLNEEKERLLKEKLEKEKQEKAKSEKRNLEKNKSKAGKLTTSKPTSESTTIKLTTSRSTTSKPTTNRSTTSKPTTNRPTTNRSTTSRPITHKVTTSKPITSKSKENNKPKMNKLNKVDLNKKDEAKDKCKKDEPKNKLPAQAKESKVSKVNKKNKQNDADENDLHMSNDQGGESDEKDAKVDENSLLIKEQQPSQQVQLPFDLKEDQSS